MKTCGACGAQNSQNASECAFCHASLSRSVYTASASAGLKRLEAEKLAFLNVGTVISKFDPQTVATYETLARATIEANEQATLSGSVSDDDLLKSDVTDVSTTRPDLFNSLSKGEEAEAMPSGGDGKYGSSQSVLLGDKERQTTLEMASIKSYQTQEFFSDSNERESVESDCSVQDISTASVVADESEIQSIASGEALACAESLAGEEDELSAKATVDAGGIADKVRRALSSGVSENDNGIGGRILRLGVKKDLVSGDGECESEDITAIEKLKRTGVFEPLCHAQVADNIASVQNLDNLIPPSEIRPWSKDAQESIAGADEVGESEDLTARQTPDSEMSARKYVALLAKEAAQHESNRGDGKDIAIIGSDVLEGADTIPVSLSEFKFPKAASKPQGCRLSRIETDHGKASASNKTVRESKGMTALWSAIIVLLVAGIIYMLYLMGIFGTVYPVSSQTRIYSATNSEAHGLEHEVLRQSVARASFEYAVAFQDGDWLANWIDRKIQEGTVLERRAILSMARDLYPESYRYFELFVKDAIDAGDYGVALSWMDQMPSGWRDAENTRAMRYRAYFENRKFIEPVVEMTEDICDEIAPLGGGSTLTFKCRLRGENAGAIKPLQSRKQSNYKSEIAAYRLCGLLSCDFKIPWNRPIRIEKSLFNTLYQRAKSSKRDVYRREFGDLTWTTADGGQYLYATLKDWVPDFTGFPIEATRLWKSWLSQERYVEKFDPFQEALSPIRKYAFLPKRYEALMRQSKGMTTEALASEISQVLTFDYLIGNWDRFSGVQKWWGINCQYKDGHIISIDNGAGFGYGTNERVVERFMMVERFSAHFIERLRSLDEQETLSLLYPDATAGDIKSFNQFWKMRELALSRVDKLIDRYGEARVLSFP